MVKKPFTHDMSLRAKFKDSGTIEVCVIDQTVQETYLFIISLAGGVTRVTHKGKEPEETSHDEDSDENA